ncbi:CsgG/HfaB family protein, partial [Shewanella sp. S1-49-MNA-CIBAN-0167]|uniref:CsgG/HfaB family protein n=1 Tax=Shewanella sp. S1-49-MNA-CIBAN-0167 TaxID=3140468 RepID=UPI00331CF284
IMKRLLLSLFILSLSACSSIESEFDGIEATTSLMPKGETYYDLVSLPSPQGSMVAAVYDFRDQTGQYKPIPSSNFSTAVPQSGTAFLA